MSAAAAAPFQFEDWMLPPVKDLVQVVGRAFYSDEHVVVLDMLTQYRMLRDDELEIRFKLPRNQVLKILGFLTTERLVCRREVKESRRGKRSRVAGAPGTEAPAAAAASTHDDSDSEYIDEDDEEDKVRAVNRVKVTVYYINPCYFVDMIRYRVWRIKTAMQQQERSNENKKAYQCTACSRRFTEMEALQFLMTSNPAAMASSTPTFVCSACKSPLNPLDVGAVVTSIGQTLVQFEQAMKGTKIQALLDRLVGVELEGNHPDEHILQGLLSMLTDSSTPADMVGGVITSLGTEIKVLTEEEPVAAPPLPAQASSSSTVLSADEQVAMLQRIEMDNRNRAIIAEATGEAPMLFMKSEPKPDPAVFVTGQPAAVSAPLEVTASASHVKAEVTLAAPAVEEDVEEDEVMFSVNGVMKRFDDITEDDQGMMSQEEFKAYAEYAT